MNKGDVYKCEVCGNVVSIVDVGGGTLVCCDQDMKMLKPKTATEEGKEKHVPVMEVDGNKITVNVGSIQHPMEDKHHIELIQLVKNEKVIAEKRLYPGEVPKAVFYVENADGIKAREFCNLHGLWSN